MKAAPEPVRVQDPACGAGKTYVALHLVLKIKAEKKKAARKRRRA